MNTRAVAVIVGLLAAASPLHAQDAAPSPDDDAVAPAAAIHASFDVGYRFSSVNGSDDTFRQLFDVTDGARIFAIDLQGQTKPGTNALVDTFFVTASGLGGDPFPTLQANITKAQRYNLRVNWRGSRFFDRAPSMPLAIEGFDTQAVTDRHAWTTNRQIGNVAWTFEASKRLHLLFNYDRVSNTGTLQTTRSLDYVGAAAAWASFARANSYELVGPTRNTADRLTAGLSYGADRWTLSYRAGYQALHDRQTFAPLLAPERSINVIDAVTASEPLATLGWVQTRKLTTPVSELSVVVKPTSTVEWRSDYMFYRYRGPFSLDAAFTGSARTVSAGAPFSPYDAVVSVEGETSTPNSVLDQGVTWRPLAQWAFDASYRYSRASITSDAQLSSVVGVYPTGTAAAVTTREEVETEWRNTLHTVELSTSWSPTAALMLRPGIRWSRRDVVANEDGIVNPGATNRERTIWPEITVGYRPVPQFSARGSYQVSDSNAPYTRMSASQRAIGRVLFHIEPTPAFTIDASANRTDAEQEAAAFISHSRSAAVTLAYALSERFSVSGGFDYQSILGIGSGTFLRGTLPITELPLNDREIDRVWQAGVTVQPTKAFGVTATANFDRTTGLDSIFGEPALYGPQSLLYATGTVYYDVDKVGRISVDLQRSSLTQDILPLNDFHANLLTLRFSHAF